MESAMMAYATLSLPFLRGRVKELEGGRSFAMEGNNLNAGYSFGSLKD